MRSMSVVCLALLLMLAGVNPAAAQNGAVSVTGAAWLDLFAGPAGGVVYPQYNFRIGSKRVVVTGFGFWEKAPQEPDFTNHVNTASLPWFDRISLRSEVGGRTGEFRPEGSTVIVPPAGFFQIGPQVNLHRLAALPGVDYLVASYLPHLAGIRPDNTLLAGGTKRLKPGEDFTVFVEGYRRFFPDGPDYGEYWVLFRAARLPRLGFGAFLLQDGDRTTILGGVRLEFLP